ncbi:MAG TPA: hypothetical protein VM386_07450, partial [Acidimicrobiales bacterium]|nr:hypothetical protein [Acidimicrobiales bacterium]
VAGVEATKYPLGYPLVLALFDVLGLSVTATAIALNLALVVALAGAVVAAVPAAVYAVAGTGVWGSVYVVMPDLGFLVLAALVLWRTGRLAARPDVWVLTALVAGATLLKSTGLLLALAAGVAVVFGARPLRRLAWVPVAAGVALTGLMAALNAPHPEHTTGYARTFFLVQATDAAQGEATLVDIAGRLVERADLVLRDVGFALVGSNVPTPWSWLIGLALVAAGAWALRGVPARRAYVLAFLAIWLPAMALWPYSSVRFQLPLVPLAAVGVGWLAAGAARRLGSAGAVAAVAVLGAYVVNSAVGLRTDVATERARVGAVADDTEEMVAWGRTHIPEEEVIASLAYREIAYRLDRPVVPLGYTTDVDQLWDQAVAADARWLVVMPSLYGSRGAIEERLLAAFAGRLRLAHDTPTVDTYELLES